MSSSATMFSCWTLKRTDEILDQLQQTRAARVDYEGFVLDGWSSGLVCWDILFMQMMKTKEIPKYNSLNNNSIILTTASPIQLQAAAFYHDNCGPVLGERAVNREVCGGGHMNRFYTRLKCFQRFWQGQVGVSKGRRLWGACRKDWVISLALWRKAQTPTNSFLWTLLFPSVACVKHVMGVWFVILSLFWELLEYLLSQHCNLVFYSALFSS